MIRGKGASTANEHGLEVAFGTGKKTKKERLVLVSCAVWEGNISRSCCLAAERDEQERTDSLTRSGADP